MEPLPRHRRGRKHSAAGNAVSPASSPSFSFNSPYDGLLLSKGGKNRLGAHEYAEIFSGSPSSSSIPVLDLSSLDERIASDELQSSRLDYSNIFGGLRNDDVAIPYEELFKGAAKRNKAKISADVHPPCQESSSLHSSAKTKMAPGEASDQEVDVTKQQFNMSFNKTSQGNSDASNGKTHIAQLHAVPGFTYFVDETSRPQKREGGNPVSSLKREVSRTWSFSGGGVDRFCEKSHIPHKSCNVNEINLKAHSSELPSPSSHPSNPNVNDDPKHSKFSSFDSKDASEKSAGQYSPPHFDEELDENSVAAASAAALKKAVEQAQESIRIARMIMERRKEGLQGDSKPRSTVWSEVKDKNETRIDFESGGLKENNARETNERLNSTIPLFAGTNGSFAPSLNHTEILFNPGKTEVERVGEKVAAAKGTGDACAEVGKRFATPGSRNGRLYIGEELALGTVEAAEEHGKAVTFTGLVANVEGRTETSEMEPGQGALEQLTVHQLKGHEAVGKLVESAPNASKSVHELEKSVDEASIEFKATVNITNGNAFTESSERILDTMQEEKTVHESGGNLRIILKDEATVERDDVADVLLKHEKKYVGHEEMVTEEHLTVRKLEFNYLLSKLRSLAERDMLGHNDMEKISETCTEQKETWPHGKSRDEENGLIYEEAQVWFESEQQRNDHLDGKASEREPEIHSEVVEDGNEVNVVHEPGMDVDEHKSSETYEQYEIVEKLANNSKFEAAETMWMEASYSAEVHESDVDPDDEETVLIHKGLRCSEIYQDEFDLQTGVSENDLDEAVDACANDTVTIICDAQYYDSLSISSEIKRPCDVGLNDVTEEYQAATEGCKESGNLTRELDTFSSVEEEEVEKLFHLEVNDMPGTDSLRRCASEENFIGSKLNGAFDSFTKDSNSKSASLMDADHENKLLGNGNMFKTASEIHNSAKDDFAEVIMQNLPDLFSNDNAAEFVYPDVGPVLRHGSESESILRTVSTSVLEDMDGVSAQKSQECAEDAGDNTSNEEEVRPGLNMVFDGRECVKEQNERVCFEGQCVEVYSQFNGEPEEMERSTEPIREAETSPNMGKDLENLGGPLTMEQKDAKGNGQEVETNHCQQRIEAIKKGREREKDRIAVERVIREARERAFSEARERAEKAAMKRAAAETRQRVSAESQEKLEKAAIDSKQPADKLSNEAKIKAERAAVERATAEARERALEKAMSHKTYIEARTQAERYSTERFSSSARDKGLKHSFSSSDLEKFDETTSESAQRRKARLERHQRIMERAAKALAEKNKRDLLALKEQAERNRLAETLDTEIKRWASGKEGNLRALLSTLQYILGQDSGWQPTSLTEIITTAAVKKAYRKATLCVHPDKLQQRGASIQQKYTCEKVFDLLKAAWNRFNSEGS